MLVYTFLYALLTTLEIDTTNAASLSYDLTTGTLTVSDASGVTIASGDDVADVWGQLHP